MDSWPSRKRGRITPPADRRRNNNSNNNNNNNTNNNNNNNDHALLIATAGLSAQNAARLRTVDSCLQHVALLPFNHFISTALVKAGVDYHNLRCGGQTAAELGEPFWHIWKTLVLSLLR
ncbi:unnamed protein product [Polarella glacialis]|uniref:Uncharacterized protein n=1 Tax=Polarella glacialis TaxID=89957 RepID=A0A813FV80_POLGL|nr:unnamed protein product [Polarella glacialis]